MEPQLDPLHLIGYLGALGSLIFGANQLRIILTKHDARNISVFDYAMRVLYSALLGVYSIGIQNIVFIVVNFGAALLSASVAAAAILMQKQEPEARS